MCRVILYILCGDSDVLDKREPNSHMLLCVCCCRRFAMLSLRNGSTALHRLCERTSSAAHSISQQCSATPMLLHTLLVTLFPWCMYWSCAYGMFGDWVVTCRLYCCVWHVGTCVLQVHCVLLPRQQLDRNGMCVASMCCECIADVMFVLLTRDCRRRAVPVHADHD